MRNDLERICPALPAHSTTIGLAVRFAAVTIAGRYRLGAIIALAAFGLAACAGAQAANGTWAGTANGSNPVFGELWSDSTNWQSGVIPGTIGGTTNTDTVFYTVQSGHYTITLDADYNVKNINSTVGAHGHAIATENGSTLSLTSGGQITSSGTDKYYAPIQLEGGTGGGYTFSGTAMKIYAPVVGTATTGGTYDLTLSGSGTNEVFTQNASGSLPTYTGSIGDGDGGGTLSVIKAGSGQWALRNANTYSGSTTVRGGTLAFSQASSFGTGSSSIELGDGGTGIGDAIELRFLENVTLARNVVANNSNPSGTTTIAVRDNRGGPVLSGTLTLNRSIQFVNTNSGALNVSGVISGVGGFTKSGADRLTLSAANTFQGDAVVEQNGGTLRIANLNALQNATLDSGASGTQVVEWYVGTSVASNQTYNLGGLKGADALAVSNNLLSIGSNSQSTEYSGIISGTGGRITKVGTGALTFSGNHTYQGSTTISAGTLLVTGVYDAAATGAVSVASGAVLGGTGTLRGATTVSGGIAPGSDGIGTLSILDGVTWNAGDPWTFNLGTPAASLAAASSASDADLLSLTGAFTQGTGSGFTFDFGNSGGDGWYKLVGYGSTTFVTGSAFSASNLPSGKTAEFTVDPGTSALYVQIVPEPATLPLTGVAVVLAGLGAWRKRPAGPRRG